MNPAFAKDRLRVSSTCVGVYQVCTSTVHDDMNVLPRTKLMELNPGKKITVSPRATKSMRNERTRVTPSEDSSEVPAMAGLIG